MFALIAWFIDYLVNPWHAMIFIGTVSSLLIAFCLVCMYLEKREII